MRIGLVGCVATKLPTTAQAQDLYNSPLFKGRRRWVEITCDRWFVISAKYGLVAPTDIVAPYNESLVGTSAAHKYQWARRVVSQLEEQVGELRGHIFEIHAGIDYRDYGLVRLIKARGAKVTIPTQRLGIGKLLRVYNDGPLMKGNMYGS